MLSSSRPTASGKTLCYNLPVIHAAAAAAARKALYLFPTKALAQDQVAELLELNRGGQASASVLTPSMATRRAMRARRCARTGISSSPIRTCCTQGILPHHTKWAQFFENLKFVVIDEMHTYRGVFGSHVANVIRRLNRICGFYGVRPIYIFCSATIANPGELASGLLGASGRGDRPVGRRRRGKSTCCSGTRP